MTEMKANKLYPIVLETDELLLQAKTAARAHQVIVKGNDLNAAVAQAAENYYLFGSHWMPYIQYHYRKEIAMLLSKHGPLWAGRLTTGGWRGGNRIDGDISSSLYTADGFAAAKEQQRGFSAQDACAGQHPAHACRVCGPVRRTVELKPRDSALANVIVHQGEIPTNVRARVRNYGGNLVVSRLGQWKEK